jgi:hypothetical protein
LDRAIHRARVLFGDAISGWALTYERIIIPNSGKIGLKNKIPSTGIFIIAYAAVQQKILVSGLVQADIVMQA